MCYQNINAKNKLNLHTYGIHLLNPYKTVVSYLNLTESKSPLYIFPTSDYACSLEETLLFMVQSLVFFHTVRAVVYWHKIYVTSTPVHAYLTAVSQGGRVQTIACLLYTSPSPRDGLLSRMPSSA